MPCLDDPVTCFQGMIDCTSLAVAFFDKLETFVQLLGSTLTMFPKSVSI